MGLNFGFDNYHKLILILYNLVNCILHYQKCHYEREIIKNKHRNIRTRLHLRLLSILKLLKFIIEQLWITYVLNVLKLLNGKCSIINIRRPLQNVDVSSVNRKIFIKVIVTYVIDALIFINAVQNAWVQTKSSAQIRKILIFK